MGTSVGGIAQELAYKEILFASSTTTDILFLRLSVSPSCSLSEDVTRRATDRSLSANMDDETLLQVATTSVFHIGSIYYNNKMTQK